MATQAITAPITAATTNNGQGGQGAAHTAPTCAQAAALRDGIDPGDELTAKGRARRGRKRRVEDQDPDDITRHRFNSYHIRRAFDLFGHLPHIINSGIKRRAREELGETTDGIMSETEYETFLKIMSHMVGLDEDSVRYKDDPLTFRKMIRVIKDGADQARSNDIANLKKDIGLLVTDDKGLPVIGALKKDDVASTKSDRGFQNDHIGRLLCPVTYDWDDPEVRQGIRDGKYAITADQWPRFLYSDCRCDLDNMELGLGRNTTLLRVVKYIFTGRSSAFSDHAGGKTTRAGNAELAGMVAMSPNAVAYGACMLRFAVSSATAWTKIDGEFNMQDFYWNVVDMFEAGDEFSKGLLDWWNYEVFGTSIETSRRPTEAAKPLASSISILKDQRAAKRMRLLTARDSNVINGITIVQSSMVSQQPEKTLGSATDKSLSFPQQSNENSP